jgi:tellurite resistance protein
MNADKLRCAQDREMAEALLQNPQVARVNERIAKQEEKGNLGVRRHLLSTSVRLSPVMASELHATASDCAARLGIDIPLELYVFPSPSYNAACVKPEAGRLFVLFSSSLLEAFEPAEIRFVMGHELGHHVFGHHDVPVGWILRGDQRPDPRLALDLTAWSRYAEVSADRAGAYCAQDLEAVAHALFKLASGLSERLVNFDLADFLKQVDEMQLEAGEPGQGAPTSDWFLTHPFSPLRVKALQLFDQSELMRKGGTTVAELDVGVHGLMSIMEPSYLDGRTGSAEAMRRLLFAGSIAVITATGEVTEAEITVFEKFFGDRSYSAKLDLDKIKVELAERIRVAREQTSLSQRMQVMRDLCTVAGADGQATEELAVLKRITKELGIPALFVDQLCTADAELD